ncbi:DUF58 domain-containing protein [Natronoglomus mannanivorans]|uniref:DUF58 domain-containing protein n=1 Tax=Natronoglomus mannanivorans TaxID=2979990 RepID=A0AAP2YXW5_9EURY|nr:DUF58 domain-containing protein [Halobacteria archaeon AArc-xg1-1]
MYLERRSWGVGIVAILLAALAVVFTQPIALVGSALVGGWLLARQALFLAELERTVESISIAQSPARTSVRTGETVPVTLTATLEEATPLAFDVRAGLPTGARATVPLVVSAGAESATTSVELTADVAWPTTGRYQFDDATMTVTDGWFRETLTVGETATVTVEPRGTGLVHVGEGGTRVSTAYGAHRTHRSGSGLQPTELREYVPGDTADRIDWKATARLGTPHVREYETETDRRTLFVVDHRTALGMGPRAETKLAYLREAALATMASTRQSDDPIGLLTVGDDGVTHRIDPLSTPEQYAAIRRRLLELEPTAPDRMPEWTATDVDHYRRPTAAGFRRRHTTVAFEGESEDEDESAFATALRPFYAEQRTYDERLESDPLSGAVQMAHKNVHGSILTIIFTDDSAPDELRETVELARRNGNRVTVMLTPTVLYETGGVADIDRAYDRYLDFEELRRDLAAMDRVVALEVGPDDRLSSLLASRRADDDGAPRRPRSPAHSRSHSGGHA